MCSHSDNRRLDTIISGHKISKENIRSDVWLVDRAKKKPFNSLQDMGINHGAFSRNCHLASFCLEEEHGIHMTSLTKYHEPARIHEYVIMSFTTPKGREGGVLNTIWGYVFCIMCSRSGNIFEIHSYEWIYYIKCDHLYNTYCCAANDGSPNFIQKATLQNHMTYHYRSASFSIGTFIVQVLSFLSFSIKHNIYTTNRTECAKKLFFGFFVWNS